MFGLALSRFGIEGNAKQRWVHTAEQVIDIGHRQRASCAVGSGSWSGSGTFRAHRKGAILKSADRPSTRSHGINFQGCGHEPNAVDDLLESVGKLAIVTSHIAAGASHVQSDNLVDAALVSAGGGSNQSTGWATQ